MGAPVKDRLCVPSPLLGAMIALQGRFSASRWMQEFAQHLMAKPRLGTQSLTFGFASWRALVPYERTPINSPKAQNPFTFISHVEYGVWNLTSQEYTGY
jgi:hypothetical protein